MNFKGQTALVTGASSGIGAAFAREFACRGANLVLVARSEDKLKRVAEDLSTRHSVRAEVVAADLSHHEAVFGMCTELAERSIDVDVLVNSAGFGMYAPMSESDPARLDEMVSVNALAVAQLCRAYLPGMLERDRGVIINVSSLGAFLPTAYMAAYGATKAFVLSLTQAMWAETRRTAVRVTAVCPGSVDTNFFDVIGEIPGSGNRVSPEDVVDKALRSIEHGQSVAVPGVLNRLMAVSLGLVPRQTAARAIERLWRPKSDNAQVRRHQWFQSAPKC